MLQSFLDRAQALAKEQQEAAERAAMSADALFSLQLQDKEPSFCTILHPLDMTTVINGKQVTVPLAIPVTMHLFDKNRKFIAEICNANYAVDLEKSTDEFRVCERCKEEYELKSDSGKIMKFTNRPQIYRCFLVFNHSVGPDGIERESSRGTKYRIKPLVTNYLPLGEHGRNWNTLCESYSRGKLFRAPWRFERDGRNYFEPMQKLREDLEEEGIDLTIPEDVVSRFAPPVAGTPETRPYIDMIHSLIFSSMRNCDWKQLGLTHPGDKKNKQPEKAQAISAPAGDEAASVLNQSSAY